MRLKEPLMALLLALAALSTVLAQEEIGIDQLERMMESAQENLTTYTYERSAKTDLRYTNGTIERRFGATKSTSGTIDLTNQSGWWSSNLTDETSGETLRWDGYLMDGTEYWREDHNWTSLNYTDPDRLLDDYDEIPGQISLIRYSDMSIVGSESIDGDDSYKLMGSPRGPIYNGMVGLQLLVAYLTSPFPLPEDLRRRTLNIRSTGLVNNSSIVLTAWVSRETALLRRLDINSSLTITPRILNMSPSSPDFRIESGINESTIYSGFGDPVRIDLPMEAQNESGMAASADWRWSLFGSVRP